MNLYKFKKTVFITFLFFASIFVFAEQNIFSESQKKYQDAISYYEVGDYGKALKCTEDAILYRKQQIEDEIALLKTALQPYQVRRVGDKIYDVLKVLNERSDYDAINLIDFYLKKKGESYFSDSVSNLLSYLDSIKVFPEAQKILGDVYKIEGEYKFAEDYYRAALENSSVLDIPDARYEILYLLADLKKLQNDEDAREEWLLLILTEDPNYEDDTNLNADRKKTALTRINAMKATIRADKKDSMEKFFSLYRADSYYMLAAYSDLAELYDKAGEKEKAFTFATLSAITGFTKVENVIKKRNSEFNSFHLEDVFTEAALYDDIISWGIENKVWKSFNFLAEITQKEECYIFSNELLKVIANYSPDSYYKNQAKVLLQKINNKN